MSNPIGQVASATSGLLEKNMANVIDSLKRLERIGSEHSETTKKIIEAAHDLSQKIVGLYAQSGEINIATMGVSPLARYYSLRRNKNAAGLRMIGDPDPLCLYVEESGKGKFVDADRESALRFASDIAGGLLSQIETDLERRERENQAAMMTLESARMPKSK